MAALAMSVWCVVTTQGLPLTATGIMHLTVSIFTLLVRFVAKSDASNYQDIPIQNAQQLQIALDLLQDPFTPACDEGRLTYAQAGFS